MQKQQYMSSQVDIHDLVEFPSLKAEGPQNEAFPKLSSVSGQSGALIRSDSDHSDERKVSPELPRAQKKQSWSQMLNKKSSPSSPSPDSQGTYKVSKHVATSQRKESGSPKGRNGNGKRGRGRRKKKNRGVAVDYF